MAAGDVRRLSAAFEMAGHSVDHVVLTNLDRHEILRQVADNKRWLEDVTGRPIPGFAYVRGRYNNAVKEIVKEAGFEYARTTENFRCDGGSDPHEMPTTLQLYPHDRSVFLRNFARNPRVIVRGRLLAVALTTSSFAERLNRVIATCEASRGVLHLWGHSWEIEENNLWGTLEAVLRSLSERSYSIAFATNHQVQVRRSSPLALS
jgi:peptidoglycan/xylan/chitin deacetylase (PgdA/CDA1 family)